MTATNSSREFSNLDLLRSIAVLLVVAEHFILDTVDETFTELDTGWLGWLGIPGVLLFFVHTSLVLLWSLERRPQIADFYVRRIFRIYPLAVIAILFTAIFHAPVSGPYNGHNVLFTYIPPTPQQLVAHLLLLQNFFGGNSIVGVLWSLSYEVQMYIFLPMIFFFASRNMKIWPLLLLWLVTVLAFRNDPMAFPINFFATTPYFLCGAMAYVGFARCTPRLPWWLLPIAISVLELFFMTKPSFQRGWYIALVIGLLLPHLMQLPSGRLQRASKAVAKYSYGIYLAHPFCLALAFNAFRDLNFATKTLIFATSLPLSSILLYHFIESPMISLGGRMARALTTHAEKRKPADA